MMSWQCWHGNKKITRKQTVKEKTDNNIKRFGFWLRSTNTNIIKMELPVGNP